LFLCTMDTKQEDIPLPETQEIELSDDESMDLSSDEEVRLDEKLQAICDVRISEWLANHGQKLFDLNCSKFLFQAGRKDVAKSLLPNPGGSKQKPNIDKETIPPNRFAESRPSTKRRRLG